MPNATAEPTIALAPLCDLARAAGLIIWRMYEEGCAGRDKPDGSPVTEADLAAEAVILEGLARIAPGVPVAAEEQIAAGDAPDCADRFFLVDALDGTRAFVNRQGGGEFTVNIALIEGGRPRLGVIYAPMSGMLYAGGDGAAFAQACTPQTAAPLGPPRPIRVADRASPPWRVLASRSGDTTGAVLQKLGAVETRTISSSLKFALLADGEADIYPRLAPVSEWDVAAGEAVLTAAGGVVIGADGAPLRYGQAADAFRVRSFLAAGGPAAAAAGRGAYLDG